ncbi:unnamed protein product [Rotaria socialis]|uniref:Uncharacterized protein n=1 Tax=Rotaria socialis TaxID=392032 RepID=A0A821XCV8_9BILA|nr:unnamed protein product [Rotaria socialis]
MPVYMKILTYDIIKQSFRKSGLFPFDPEAPDYSKLTLEAERTSDVSIFEGVENDGKVDRSTQVTRTVMLNVRTQTDVTKCSRPGVSDNLIYDINAGSQAKMLLLIFKI